MSNQELVDAGMKRMDETDQAIERSKQVKKVTERSMFPPYLYGNILVPFRWWSKQSKLGLKLQLT